jgi:hypothetical protein
MPKVKLNRRWGANNAGSTVDVSAGTAEWLRSIGYAGPVQAAPAPGSDGPDPVISGDVTRRRARTVKRDRAEGENSAAPVERSLPARRPGYRGEARATTTAAAGDSGTSDSGTSDDAGKHRKASDSKSGASASE